MIRLLSNDEKQSLIEKLNNQYNFAEFNTESNAESLDQLKAKIEELRESLSNADVDILFVAEKTDVIFHLLYANDYYKDALEMCVISRDYYKEYEESSGEITTSLTQLYWNYYYVFKQCNSEKSELLEANRAASSRIKKYYNDDKAKKKEMLDELSEDRYELDDKERRTIKGMWICVLVIALFLLANIISIFIYGYTLVTAYQVYRYDGSSIRNPLKQIERIKVDDDNYRQGIKYINEGDYSNAVHCLESTINDLSVKYGEDDKRVAAAHFYLGKAYSGLIRYSDAAAQFTDAYVAFKKIYGDDDEITNAVYCYLNLCEIGNSDYDTAIKTLYNSYEKTKFFEIRWNISTYLAALLSQTGDYEEAIKWRNKSIGMLNATTIGKKNKIYWENYTQNLISRGFDYIKLGEKEDAIKDFDQAYECACKAYGENFEKAKTKEERLIVAWVYQGQISKHLAKYDKAGAVKVLKQLIDYFNQDKEHEEQLLDALNLYDLLTGEEEFSISAYEEVAESIKDKWGEKSVSYSSCLLTLAKCYGRKGDWGQCIEYSQRVIEIGKDLLEPSQQMMIGAYYECAFAYYNEKDFEKSLEYAEKGLIDIIENNLAPNEETVEFLNVIAADFYEMGQYQKAMIIWEMCDTINREQSYSQAMTEKVEQHLDEVRTKYSNEEECKEKANELITRLKADDGNNAKEIVQQILGNA